MDEKLQELIDKAEQGDVDAMILVSKHYKNGILTEQDDVKAHEYRLMAAEREKTRFKAGCILALLRLSA